jgi:asparagine N-glycosylation enzyme membrane subunit Stt3
VSEQIEVPNEQTTLASIDRVSRRVQRASDRWHAAESLIVGVCAAGLLVGHRALPQWGWRWVLGYFLVGSVALAVRLWRRRVDRSPSRWATAVWPATFVLIVVSVTLVDVVMPLRLSPLTVAVAALPTLPGLAAMVGTRFR